MRDFPRGPHFHSTVEEPDTEQLKALLEAAGYPAPLAEALAENGHNPDSASLLSIREVLDLYLQWQGIIGFTESILRAVTSLLILKPTWHEQVMPTHEEFVARQLDEGKRR